VHEDHAPATGRGGKDGIDRWIVETHVVHGREQADRRERRVLERPIESRRRVWRRRVEHERAHEPRRVTRDRRRHRLLIARHARDQHGARDLMLVELGDPALGERRVLTGRIPAEPRGQGLGRLTRRRRREIAGERAKERRGEEVTMRVADHL
jgi:hypothetical protein